MTVAVAQSDLSGLAAQAQHKGRGLRPALLRVQARAFADAPVRSRELITSFEALALGFLPLVSDEVVEEIGAILSGVPETPGSVLELIRSRDATVPPVLGAPPPAPPASMVAECPDHVLAADRDVVLDGRVLQELVGRAQDKRSLARLLLARNDLSVLDRAALFRHADEETRDAIREELVLRSAVNTPPPALAGIKRATLLFLADAGRFDEFCSEIAEVLAVERLRLSSLTDPAEAELFALSLVAAGLGVEDCIKVFLTIEPALARSVPLVFHLAALCRSTSAGVASALLRCACTPLGETSQRAARNAPALDGNPPLVAAEPAPLRRKRVSPKTEAGLAAPNRARSDLADRRSTPTKGRDRI